MSNYIMNMETQKIELHFDKSDYLALSEDLKKEIKSNFLFSRKSSAWVSRAKFPNLYRAENVAKKIGLENGGKIGTSLTFKEQMERKAERAEARAERYDYKSGQAEKNGVALQKPIEDMRGDIAFFTQPNINTSAGRAFTNKRNRMFEAWERGFDEFKKSEYYAERAAIARSTAKGTKPTSKGFIDRRLKETEKVIRAQKKNLESYRKYQERIENGEKITRYNGDVITLEKVGEWIEHAEMIIENEISKAVYYNECMEELGGVQFSKDNIKVGYIVELEGGLYKNCKCEVTSAGKVNISYVITNGTLKGYGGKAAYAEIKSVISDNIEGKEAPKHPFEVGDTYTVSDYDKNFKRIQKEYTIIKTTPKSVTLQSGEDKPIIRKPKKSNLDNCWTLKITDYYDGIVYKKEPEAITA